MTVARPGGWTVLRGMRMGTLVLLACLALAGCPSSDKTAPAITEIAPPDGATDVSVDLGLSVTFNELMDSNSFSQTAFTLATGQGGAVAGQVTYSGVTARFVPSASLAYSTQYVATIAATVTDEAGNSLGTKRQWAFTTIAEPDRQAPSVTSVTPTAGAQAVPVGVAPTATFSETMDAASVSAATFTLYSATEGAIAGQVTYSGLTAVFTPAAPLAYGVAHTAVVAGDVKDLAGNTLGTSRVWSFTTASLPDTSAPDVTSMLPKDGASNVALNTPIQAAFSEAMDPSTITATTFLLAETDGTSVSGTVAYAAQSATFTPADSLRRGASYAATVTTGAKDLAGNALSRNYTWHFAMIPATETTPPTVVSTVPAKGATGVAINSIPVATFSEAIEAASVTATAFIVYDGQAASVAGQVAYQNQQAIFTPAQSLAYGTTFTAIISGDIRDLAGNRMGTNHIWTFTTVSEPDTVPPTVLSTQPANDATAVETSAIIRATFSETIDTATLSAASFTLQDDGGHAIPGSVAYADPVAVFTPKTTLEESTLYHATLAASIRDTAGNALASAYTWAFETRQGAETTPPTVVSTTPLDTATGVSVNTTLSIVFSEDMNAATINDTAITLFGASKAAVSGQVTYAGKTAVLTPTQPLAYGTPYTAAVSGDVEDLAGNRMGSSHLWSFTTAVQADTTPPTVTTVFPAVNATGVARNALVRATFSETLDASTLTTVSFTVEDAAGNTVPGAVTYADPVVTFTPETSFAAGTAYHATLTTAVRDTAGNALAAAYTWAFQTLVETETTPPTITSTVPASGTTNVSTATTITILFSEEMDPDTVDTSTITLFDASAGAIAGTVAYAGKRATFTPAQALAHGMLHTAAVSGDVTDLAGNRMGTSLMWSFTTAAASDTTPPTVVSVSPAAAATDVETSVLVRATFSETLDASTVNTSSFTLQDAAQNSVSGTVSYSDPVVVFTPDALLTQGTVYRGTLSTAVHDTSGNALASAYTWTFQTREGVETTPPSIVSTTPVSGATGVPVNTEIDILFSEDMDTATIDATAITLFDATAGAIAGQVAYAGKHATFTPSQALAYGTLHTAAVSGDVKDRAGNSMGTSHIWSFTTASAPDTTCPTVVSVSPVKNAASVDRTVVIRATFSEALKESSITAQTFSVSDGSQSVAGSLAYADKVVSFTPAVALAASTPYTVTLHALQDLAANALAIDYTWSFTTAEESDTTAPSVLSTTPTSGATGVAISIVPSVRFSETMDQSSITSTTFVLYDPSGSVYGQVACSGATATLAPAQSLAYGTVYTAVVSATVEDLAGNPLGISYAWPFTTDTQPSITAQAPVPDATEVQVDSSVRVTFSKAIDTATLTAASFRVTDAAGTAITGTIAYAGKTASFTPAAGFTQDTVFHIAVTTAVKDTAGNPLDNDYSWAFRTAKTVETQAPSVTAATPAAGASNVAIATTLSVTFSEAMDPATLTTATFSLYDTAGMINGTIAYDGGTAIFTPSNPLAYDTFHTAVVSALVKDLAGNTMAANYIWTFTTGAAPDVTAPSIVSCTPAPNATEVVTGTRIQMEFSETIDPASLTDATLYLTDPSGNHVAGAMACSGAIVTLTPAAPLGNAIHYTATATTGIEDTSGNPLATNYAWAFDTLPTPDTQTPSVVSVTPASTATDVPIATVLTARFSEAMDATTVSAATFVLYDAASGLVDGSVVLDGQTATFTPDQALDFGKAHTAVVSSDVKDLAGNRMGTNQIWTFTTEALPAVAGMAPADAATDVEVDAVVRATFNKDMEASALTSSTFTLTDGNGQPVSGTRAYTAKAATFTPASPLAASTTYTVTLTTGVRDTNGNALAAPVTWTFRTKAVTETQAPSILSAVPTASATAVDVDTAISVSFSEAIDPTTVSAATFTVYDATAGMVTGTVTYSAQTATFTPTAPLAYGTAHTAVVSSDVKDLAGNRMGTNCVWTFTTDTLPTVTGMAPAEAATGVEVDAVVRATFSKDMDGSALTSSTFTLTDGNGQLVTGTRAYAAKAATFTPASPLAASTTYTVTLTTGVRDTNGNALAAPVTWMFCTKAVTETQAPSIVSALPAASATAVDVDTAISVSFSEAMDPTTVSAATFTVYNATTGSVSGTVAYSDQKATFTPTAPLAYGTAHTAVVSSDVEDLAGNRMGTNYVWSFTTDTLPTVTAITPAANATQVQVDAYVRATFSKAMNAASFTADRFTVKNAANQAVAGTIACVGSDATFTPSANLAESTTYTVTIASGVQDAAGNALASDYTWSFQTSAVSDTQSPSVVSTSPAANALAVSVNAVLTATFSEAMDPATVSAASFVLYEGSNGTVPGTITYDGVTATFTPSRALAYATSCVAVVTNDATDAAGNRLATNHLWPFTTADPPDTTAPTVSSTSPAAAATYVPLNAVVEAVFSETIDAATVSTATFTLQENGGSTIAGTVSHAAQTASFTPSAALAYYHSYTATLSTGIKDVAGNTLAAPYTWMFTTTPDPADSFVHANGNKLAVGAAHTPVLLRGVHFNTDDRTNSTISWPNHHFAADYQRVAAMGMNTIRFALNYATFEDDADTYHYRTAAWDWLDQNVAWARQNNLYLILTMVQPQGGTQGTANGLLLWNVAENQDRLKALWTAIAARYVNEPVIAGYDLLHEPQTPNSLDEWKTLAQSLVEAIRAVDTNHLIVVERGYGVYQQYATYDDPAQTQFLVNDSNVMYDFHFYYPYDYTRQNLTYLGYGDGGAYPDESIIIMPADTTWNGGTYLNSGTAAGNTDWAYYEGAYCRVEDATAIAAVPSFASSANTGTVYFDDITIEEYDEGLNLVRTVLTANVTEQGGWSSWSSDGTTTFGFSSTEGHGDAKSLYITNSTGYALWSNRALRFPVQNGYYYRVSAWMKGVGVSSGATCIALANYETSPSGEPMLHRNRAYLEHTLLRFLDFGITNNVPMNVGEFGLVEDCFADSKGGAAWLQDMLGLMDTYGLNWTYYAYHNAYFGFYTGTELPDGTSARTELTDAFTSYFASAPAPDTTPPTVSNVTPGNGATNVAIATAITAAFSETLLASSAAATSVTVTYLDAGNQPQTLACTVTVSDGTMTILPATYAHWLDSGTTYTVTIATDVMDTAANPLAAPYSWTFTTAAADTKTYARASGQNIVMGSSGQTLLLRGVGFGNYVWSMEQYGNLLLSMHHRESDFDAVKELGFNSIRFYISYETFEDDSTPYVYKQSGWDYLDRNVGWAREHGVYLIINMHVPQGGFQGDPEGQNLWLVPENQSRLKALWKAIAQRYRNEPYVAGYGLVNEPIPPNSVDEWVTLANGIASEIRTVDPYHALFVERIPARYDHWEIAADTTQTQRLISDTNVVYEFHAYWPVEYAIQLTPYSVYDGGDYPNDDILACSWLEWAATNGGNPTVATGNSGWSRYTGQKFHCTDTAIVAGKPIFYCQNNPGGRVYFDNFVVEEYNASNVFVQNVCSIAITSDTAWRNNASEGYATFGLSATQGYDDAASLYIDGATGFSQWYNNLLIFPVTANYYYRIVGWMKGTSVASGSDCGMRIEFQQATYGDPVYTRSASYLDYEVGKFMQFGIDNNVPMYVGEFGASLPCFLNDKGGLYWVNDMLAALDNHGCNFSFHAYNDSRFGIYITQGELPDPAKANVYLMNLFKAFFGVK